MKKIFGIMALSSLALAVSAEPEVCSFDPSAIGVTSTAAEFPAGTELGKTASVTCVSYNGSAGSDKIKSTSGENGTSDNYDYAISLDGAILSLTSGLQGSTNPTAPSADVWENYQPEQGWMLQFNVGEIATWGELYVSSKSTGNKKYWVVEESSTGERKFIPYWQVGDFQGDGYDYGGDGCLFHLNNNGAFVSRPKLSKKCKPPTPPPPFFVAAAQKKQPWPKQARAAGVIRLGGGLLSYRCAQIYFSVMMLQIDTRFQSGSLNMLPTPWPS